MQSWIFAVEHAVLIASQEVGNFPSWVFRTGGCVDGVVVVDVVDMNLVGADADWLLQVTWSVDHLDGGGTVIFSQRAMGAY
jgi:hypothetical protein